MPIHGSKARLLLSAFEVSSVMTEGEFTGEHDLVETSTWGLTSKRYMPDDRAMYTFTGGGIWEHTGLTPGSIDELLQTKLAGSHVATYLPNLDAFGNRAHIIGGIETEFNIDSPGDDAVGFSFELEAEAGGLGRARVLRPLAGSLAISANGNGTSLDELGAAGTTTKGAAGAVHIVDKGGGAGTLTLRIQHSADNSVWNDLIVFTGRTAADLAEYIEVPGTVQRWLRATWTVTGGTWDFHVAGGRK